eukprot:CAMPEP_0177753006 /NCGR_PEP_ID=MMETSP0491_2-20121128/1220_1 /TAXON_ID=63592 /ORGANISM="Tetraselmis chuii, Strain PLY429" /LENGTH=77 /DNA_ID=CAMNT_0019268243 /DNA_START=177 /DNA_END=411 /DNA_ORIENTATION=-
MRTSGGVVAGAKATARSQAAARNSTSPLAALMSTSKGPHRRNHRFALCPNKQRCALLPGRALSEDQAVPVLVAAALS